MRLLSFRTEERSSFGALVEGKIVDLGRHLPEHESLRALLEANALVRALDTAAEESAEFRLDDVELLAPIPDPGKLLCTFDEPLGEPIPLDPKFLRGGGRKLPIAAGASNPIAAGVALVLGKSDRSSTGCRVVGITLITYLSPGSLAMGPWLVTLDEIDAPEDVSLAVTVGEREVAVTLPSYPPIVERLAAEKDLHPGDMIAVLSYLSDLSVQAGEEVAVTSSAIGTLKNSIQSEEPAD